LFLPDAQQKNVPIDGIPHYISQAWQSIREQKELNIPDQRAMVANFRCNELKDEAIASSQTTVQNLLSECNKVYPVDFNFKAMQLLNKAVDLYTDLAKQYDQLVFHKVKKELIQQLLANLFPGFDSQLKLLR
jgi:protein SEY1